MRAMLSLTWKQVDLANMRAWVASSEMKAGHSLGVPLTPEAIEVLKALPRNGDYLFQWHGARIDDCNTLAFQRAVRAAAVNPLRWHDLRHTWASWAVQSGVTLHELMLLGGWRSFSMVLRYAHFAPDHLARAAAKVTIRHSTKTGTLKVAGSKTRKKT
jgi:integrase